jgi:hypothetical protein
VFATNFYRLFETDLFAAILIIQSLPFLSAVALEGLERFSAAGNNKPYARIGPVRICAGGGWQQPSLPQMTAIRDDAACTGAVVRKPPMKERA